MTTVKVELWTASAGMPIASARRARQLEDEGWDGVGLVDSQNLAGDPYVELGLAAAATSTLQLATAVTNPVTRHPAVAATAIATIQAESGGRAVLGIGRGDSALAHLGLAPASVPAFARYVDRLQGYLRGEELAFDLDTDSGFGLRSSESLGMAAGPEGSRLRWLRATQKKVPVDVAATGPKVIALAARSAERITFAVGASPERLRWAIGIARAATADRSESLGDLDLGVYVPVLVHDDAERARQLISGAVGSYARFSVMHGRVAGPIDEDQRRSLEAVHDTYDMGSHFTQGSPQSQQLTTAAIDAFGIAGPASYCVERIIELTELGIGRVFVMPGGIGLDRDEADAAHQRLVADVLPNLR